MRALADSVLAALRDLNHEGLRVTASVGWVIHPDDAQTVDDLIAAADFCLRGAKLTGKDRALSPRGLGAGAERGAGGLGFHRCPPSVLLTDSFSDDPALDAAVSRALMFRVAAGELPETLRIARPGTTVAFAKRDAREPTATRKRSAPRASAASRRRCGSPAAARPSSTTARWR